MGDEAPATKDTETHDDAEANNDELWMGEALRRRYPLSAQRVRDLAVQQQEDSEYRRDVETLDRVHAAAGELSEKEVLDLEFSLKDLQVQGGSAGVEDQDDEQ